MCPCQKKTVTFICVGRNEVNKDANIQTLFNSEILHYSSPLLQIDIAFLVH